MMTVRRVAIGISRLIGMMVILSYGQCQCLGESTNQPSASRLEMLDLLKFSPDHVRQIGKESYLMREESQILALLQEQATGGNALTDRQVLNLISWLNRLAPSGEAVVHVNAISLSSKDNDVRVSCDSFFRNMSKTQQLDLRAQETLDKVRASFESGRFSNALVPLLLARIMVRHNDHDGRQFLLRTLAGSGDAHVLIECAATILQADAKQTDALTYLETSLSNKSLPIGDRIRAAEILVHAGNRDAISWMNSQVQNSSDPSVPYRIGCALVQAGHLEGSDVLVNVLAEKHEGIRAGSERMLIQILPEAPREYQDANPDAKVNLWKNWLQLNRSKLRWDTQRNVFLLL